MTRVNYILLLLLLCLPVYSYADSQTEQKSEQIEIHFDLNSYCVSSDYQNNRENLDRLSNMGVIMKSTLKNIDAY